VNMQIVVNIIFLGWGNRNMLLKGLSSEMDMAESGINR
jgi:hypothetical protein